MREIPLTRGQFALVDNEDYERVSAFSWHLLSKKTRIVAIKAHSEDGMNYMHQLIIGKMSGFEIDHKNGNGLDNRKENLRFCVGSQNCQNRGKRLGAYSSKFKGVSFHLQHKKYIAYINIPGKRIHIGLFRDEISAAEAYNYFASALHGKFAKLNPV